ncbi:MAG: methionyl-tRNA formyltransferase [Planctomycetota bacterium]
MNSLRLILMGTGPFAVPSFDALHRSRHSVAAVITKPEPPVKSRKGPPPAPVRTWAQEQGLRLLDPASINAPEAVATLQELASDLLVVCDYGQILRPAPLAAAKLGGINLHGSLLPKFRGAAPVQRALIEGETETGVTVIHMTPKLDGGPILGTVATPITETETAGELEERLSHLGVDLVLDCVERLSTWDGGESLGVTQEDSLTTRAPRLSKQEAELDFCKNYDEISCHVRGMQPWPVAFSHLRIRDNRPPLRIAVLEVAKSEQEAGGLAPGQLTGGKSLVVVVGDGTMEILRVRPAGKREMTGAEFMRGYQLPDGTTFERVDGS